MALCKEIALLIQNQNETGTTKNVFHKKKWNLGLVQVHVENPPTLLINSKHYDNQDKDFVKLKLLRDMASEK